MPQALITERYAAEIAGVLHGYDRIVISGQLQPICYAKGMTKYLYVHGIRIFDYTQFAAPLREAIRQHAEALAEAQGLDSASRPFATLCSRSHRLAHDLRLGCHP